MFILCVKLFKGNSVQFFVTEDHLLDSCNKINMLIQLSDDPRNPNILPKVT